MSKNIVIQEGGVGFQFTADKLETNLVGGGTCLWIPQDETALTTKTITKDGTYKASTDGYYGYSKVTVKGVGKTVGKGSDGEEYCYTTDSGGNIVETLLPSKIVVTTKPTYTAYNDGATINFEGMVVKAYDAHGRLWTDGDHPNGVIPLSELVLPVTEAEYSSTEQGAASELDTGFEQPLHVAATGYATGDTGQYTHVTHRYSGAIITLWMASGSTVYKLAASMTPGAQLESYLEETGRTIRANLSSTYTYDGQTVYYYFDQTGTAWTSVDDIMPESTLVSAINPGAAAWTMVYGLLTGAMAVPVQWARPGDEATLETSFYVYVFPRSND